MRLWVEMFWTSMNPQNNAGQPLYEAVSWNGRNPHRFVKRKSASIWGCELKCSLNNCFCILFWSASIWGCELKYDSSFAEFKEELSASIWGCELKFHSNLAFLRAIHVSLYMRLWVEIILFRLLHLRHSRQPLYEAVSWNVPFSQRAVWL